MIVNNIDVLTNMALLFKIVMDILYFKIYIQVDSFDIYKLMM